MTLHNRLSLKKKQSISRNPYVVFDFNENLEEVVTISLTLISLDFPQIHLKVRAIGIKGNALSRISEGSGREDSTVLACLCADSI